MSKISHPISPMMVDIFDTVEVAALWRFKLPDNMHQDIPLISVLGSEVFGFTPEHC